MHMLIQLRSLVPIRKERNIGTTRINVWSRWLLLMTLLCGTHTLRAAGVSVREDISFRKLTSGRCTVEVDLSPMKRFIQLLNTLTEDKAPDIEDMVKSALETTRKRLQKLEGIGKVRATHDENTMQFRIGFSFKNLKSLNRAMSHLHAHASTDHVAFFTKKGKALKRTDDHSLIHWVHPAKMQQIPAVKGIDIGVLLKDSTYTTTYRFDKKVQKMSSKAAVLDASGKTVTLAWRVFDASDASAGLENIIWLT